jgi:hypothetical protein
LQIPGIKGQPYYYFKIPASLDLMVRLEPMVLRELLEQMAPAVREAPVEPLPMRVSRGSLDKMDRLVEMVQLDRQGEQEASLS